MEKLFLPVLLFILALLFSCSRDDGPAKTDEDYLKGTWTIKEAKTYHYLNGELDKIKDTIFKEPYATLDFGSNKDVTYSTYHYTNPISGKWALNEKEKVLTTNLKIELSSSSGYGTIYFFPENRIMLVNDSELILKSPMSGEATRSNGDKFQSYVETYLEK
ncbi:MAG: hypothetical protein WBL27_11525 [Salinimicrobium sp.]